MILGKEVDFEKMPFTKHSRKMCHHFFMKREAVDIYKEKIMHSGILIA